MDLPEVAKAIDAARRVVSHLRHSAVATCALKKRQAQLNVEENRLQPTVPRVGIQPLQCWSDFTSSASLLVLRPLAKATTIMCGEMHVGLSFIYPVILNLVEDGVLRVE
ncbi:hypothetical protein AAFF_G00179580 [Aldrovandia affinis]|uniref:Uncharacterized protein n=1 Tax=Aldrovandia affinis TaxID=143900 RepID=A0AAD7RKN5_9TELE|nr:hypothetical protein AAFF_G00179580 [Aldrovandia affinis]